MIDSITVYVFVVDEFKVNIALGCSSSNIPKHGYKLYLSEELKTEGKRTIHVIHTAEHLPS